MVAEQRGAAPGEPVLGGAASRPRDCCGEAPGSLAAEGSGPSAVDHARLATSFKALADPNRLRILSIVAAAADAEVCVCDLPEPLGLTQPTVSHHLRVLVDAGLLAREKRGVWAYFSLVPGALETLSSELLRGVVARRSSGVEAPALGGAK